MFRVGVLSAFLLLSASLRAQAPDVSLGLTLVKVPEVLYAQMPPLAKTQGVLVQSVEPNSPAWRGGLRRHDIIVSLDSIKTPPDVSAVAGKLKSAKPVKLTILRAGRELVLAFDAHRKDSASELDLPAPKSFLKPGGPPAVTIQVQPLDDGQFNLALTFFSPNSGKLESLTYDGTLENIERQILSDARDRRLPDRVHDLVEVALRRVRNISQKQP